MSIAQCILTFTCINKRFITIQSRCFVNLLDFDECADNKTDKCAPNALCTNSEGSYVCRCLKGYEGDGRRCVGKIICVLCCIHLISTLACSRLQDSNVHRSWNWCENRAGAGEREGIAFFPRPRASLFFALLVCATSNVPTIWEPGTSYLIPQVCCTGMASTI